MTIKSEINSRLIAHSNTQKKKKTNLKQPCSTIVYYSNSFFENNFFDNNHLMFNPFWELLPCTLLFVFYHLNFSNFEFFTTTWTLFVQKFTFPPLLPLYFSSICSNSLWNFIVDWITKLIYEFYLLQTVDSVRRILTSERISTILTMENHHVIKSNWKISGWDHVR